MLLQQLYNRNQTTSNNNVSKVFHEPFILTGYRPPSKSWTYYAKSVFQIHNETGNVWSHLAAFFVYLYTTIYYGQLVDYWNNRSTWGILCFGIACMIYALLSTVAHLFHSRSVLAHYTFFQIDYIGIGMYGQGMCIMLFTCSGTPLFFKTVYPYFLPINCAVSIFVCMSCCTAKMFFEKPFPFTRKLLQMSACAGHIIYLMTPMYFRVYDCFTGAPHCHSDSFKFHYDYAVWFLISAMFFVSHAPERFFPGRFDLIGHGHQLFHVCITYTTVLQFKAGYEDWLAKTDDERAWISSHVDVVSTFGCILLTIVIDGIFICVARNRVKSICDEDLKCSNGTTKVSNGLKHD